MLVKMAWNEAHFIRVSRGSKVGEALRVCQQRIPLGEYERNFIRRSHRLQVVWLDVLHANVGRATCHIPTDNLPDCLEQSARRPPRVSFVVASGAAAATRACPSSVRLHALAFDRYRAMDSQMLDAT